MKKVLLLTLLVAVVAMGAFSIVSAQDEIPAVNLVMWHQEQESQEAFEELFAMWAAEFSPDSTLEVVNIETEQQRQDVLTAGLAGEGLPDILYAPNDSFGVWADAGVIMGLDDLYDMEMYPVNLGAAQIAGVTYGVPATAGNHLMLLYNKSLVEEAPQTWEELIAVAREVEENNEGVQGFAYNLNEPFWFLPFVHGFGGSTFDEEGNITLDTEEWVAAYQFVHDLKFVEEIVPQECDYNCASDLFKEGSNAIIINGDWSLGEYLDIEVSPALGPDNLGIAPWPALPNGERPQPFTAGKFWGIPVTVEGDNLDAVVAFTTWATQNAEAVTMFTVETSRLPAIASVEIDPEEEPVLAASLEALLTGVGMPANPDLRCMWDSVRPNLEAVMNDSMSAEDAAFEAQLAAEICLESS